MKLNNYYCSELNCNYQTNSQTPEEASRKLIQDGGYDVDKRSKCPKCRKDSLVFLPK